MSVFPTHCSAIDPEKKGKPFMLLLHCSFDKYALCGILARQHYTNSMQTTKLKTLAFQKVK